MNWQLIVVGIIVLLAFLYTAKMVWQRVKSFAPKSGCGNDCGCEAKSNRKSFAQIGKH